MYKLTNKQLDQLKEIYEGTRDTSLVFTDYWRKLGWLIEDIEATKIADV